MPCVSISAAPMPKIIGPAMAAGSITRDSAGIGRTSGSDLKSHTGVPGVLTNPWGDGEDVPAEGDLLTWTLHNAWLQYRYSMDEAILRDTVFPLLRRSVNYYRHFLKLVRNLESHAVYRPPNTLAGCVPPASADARRQPDLAPNSRARRRSDRSRGPATRGCHPRQVAAIRRSA